MSGMYNMVFGLHPFAPGLMNLILGIDIKMVPRFRDCYPVQYKKEALKIEMVTRAGGGNMAEYADEIEALEKHPHYVGSQDDSFDSTYRVFWFDVPLEEENDKIAEFKGLLEKYPGMVVTKPLGVRWKEALDAMEGASKPEPKIILTGGESS